LYGLLGEWQAGATGFRNAGILTVFFRSIKRLIGGPGALRLPGDAGADKNQQAEFLELDRIIELDGIRGLALVMVLWLHCFLLEPTSLIIRLANSIGGSMFIALDLFFVLSGFLITGILIRTRDVPRRARNFYVRRALRIFPAYYFVILFIFVIYPVFYGPLDQVLDRREAIYYVFYIQNLWHAWTEIKPSWPGLQHLWSMAVEEQFYLLWPLVVWKTPPAQLVRVCAWVFVVSVTLKFVLIANGASVYEVYLPTYTRVEGLAAGAGLAALWYTHGIRTTPNWLRLAGIVATLALLFLIFRKSGSKVSPLNMSLHVVSSTVAFAWMIFATVSARPGAAIRHFFRNRMLRFLGRYSYGIYLLHWVVYWQIKYFVLDAMGMEPNMDNWSAIVAGVAIVLATVALAFVMYHTLELPLLRLKRFFTSSRSATRSGPAAGLATAHDGH
jgi:peptidoglycan/LPS O-acetylase OafA/YrhL